MAAVLLDTTVVIDLLRGRPGAIARLRALRDMGDLPHTCAITVEETVRGLRPGEVMDARGLFSGLRTAALGDEEGWQAGEWRGQFATSGQTLSQADCLIAAAALSVGARLATGNPRDFPMAELSVEHWPPGE
jgi:predicted nucleic acid-binding protein